MKRSALIPLFALLSCLSVQAVEGTSSLILNAFVSPVLSVSMDDPETFIVIGNDRRLISSRDVGNTVVKSSYSSWKIQIDSVNKTSPMQGGLKLDAGETCIPYSFALKDGSTTVVSSFNTPSPSQSRTSMDGVSLALYLYFDHSDETSWPKGIYSDTIVLSVTTE